MRNPHGYGIIVEPGVATVEFDTVQCAHCNRIQHMTPQQSASDMGGWCFRCAQCVCGPCADKGTCTPFEKKLDMYERGQLAVLD